MTKRLGPIFQIAYVVEDIDKAVEHWAKKHGAGPFFVIKHAGYAASEYRGQNIAPDVSLAFAYSGDINIELIQQHDDAPSIFKDFVDTHGFGQQHVGILSGDLDADTQWLAEQGIPMIQRLVNDSGAETRFFDTQSRDGVLLELVQRTPEGDGAFQYMREAAKAWDGIEAVAPIPDL